MKMFVPDGKGGREEWKVFRGDPGPQGDPGKKGDKGDKGDSGTTSWSGITDKPAKFTPDAHKHTKADISDLPEVSDTPKGDTLVVRSASGAIRAGEPQGPNNVTTQNYVDKAIAGCASKGDLQSLIRLVDSPPSSPTPGVLYLVAEA